MQRLLGYSPYSANLSHPADRRRVPWWAAQRGVIIESSAGGFESLMVIQPHSDLPSWTKRKSAGQVSALAVDLVDGYLSHEPNPWIDRGRSVLRSASRDFSPSIAPYSAWLRRAVEVADVVICSSPEQRESLSVFNGNVHAILDAHDEFPTLRPEEPARSDRLALFWEGQSVTLKHLVGIAPVLTELSLSQPLQLNVVTDQTIPWIGRGGVGRDSRKVIERAYMGSDVRLNVLPWTLGNVIAAARSSSVALVPVSSADEFAQAKPENRLLIAWRLGLAALVSPTPAHRRVMTSAGVDGACYTPADWKEKLYLYATERDSMMLNARLGQQFVTETHSSPQLLRKWDDALGPWL